MIRVPSFFLPLFFFPQLVELLIFLIFKTRNILSSYFKCSHILNTYFLRMTTDIIGGSRFSKLNCFLSFFILCKEGQNVVLKTSGILGLKGRVGMFWILLSCCFNLPTHDP